MFWILRLFLGKSEYVWLSVRILRETAKAILVENGRRFWIAKSQVVKIRLKKGGFEIYVREDLVR